MTLILNLSFYSLEEHSPISLKDRTYLMRFPCITSSNLHRNIKVKLAIALPWGLTYGKQNTIGVG